MVPQPGSGQKLEGGIRGARLIRSSSEGRGACFFRTWCPGTTARAGASAVDQRLSADCAASSTARMLSATAWNVVVEAHAGGIWRRIDCDVFGCPLRLVEQPLQAVELCPSRAQQRVL